jgi:hypothetical protein
MRGSDQIAAAGKERHRVAKPRPDDIMFGEIMFEENE